jgi:sugar phosphate isomerase/epimerase
MTQPLTTTDKLCIHTITTKPWNVHTAIAKYERVGVRGITIWRQYLDGEDLPQLAQSIENAGLTCVSLCRGGFFPYKDATQRQHALDDNRRAIEQATALRCPLIVLVCGADPHLSLSDSRKYIQEGIASILPEARAAGVKLAVEPLHPMYADTRSAINTMKQANDLCDALDSSEVGVAVDVYHVWWDPDLEEEILRTAKANRLWAFHVCDWRSPTEDLLNDRGLMGEGCIPIRQIRGWVENAGFSGYNEVEIFSNRRWKMDQDEFLKEIVNAYLEYT